RRAPGWICLLIALRKCRFSLRNPPLSKLHDDPGTLHPRWITAVFDTLCPDSCRYCVAPRFARRDVAPTRFASLLETHEPRPIRRQFDDERLIQVVPPEPATPTVLTRGLQCLFHDGPSNEQPRLPQADRHVALSALLRKPFFDRWVVFVTPCLLRHAAVQALPLRYIPV